MLGFQSSYWNATRHPVACVFFVLPLLVIYEAGLFLIGYPQPDHLRNGADAWVRNSLTFVGLNHVFWAPILLLVILVAWALLHKQPFPKDLFGTWLGMTVEIGMFALVLWGLSQGLWPIFDSLAMLSLNSAAAPVEPAMLASHLPEPAVEQILSYLGAGIYEETLFRLVLFSSLLGIFYLADFPAWLAMVLAGAGSSLLFSAAHHLGPHGESFNPLVFSFRTLAGVYFAALFRYRGFGIAVGAHTGYDVLVGLLVEVK